MTGDPALIDRAALTDASRCPGCGAALAGPRCQACGVQLSGRLGHELWQVSQQVAALLVRREDLLLELRVLASQPAPAAPATVSTPTTARVITPAAPASAAPAAPAPATVPSPRRAPTRRPIRVQSLLVGLGALLLAVAAVVFLVFSWDRMSLGTRSTVVAAVTLAVLATAGWLRPRLADTAEAVGALGVVLVLADAWAVRRLAVLGADRPSVLVYAAGAAAVCGALLAGWAAVSRVRAGSLAASGLLPAAVALAGIGPVADGADGRLAVLALVAAAAATLGRRILPAAWAAERGVLRVVAGGALTLAVAGCALLAADRPGSAAALLLAAAAVAAAQVLAGQPEPGGRGWSFAAGVLAGSAALPAAVRIVRSGDLDPVWLIGLTPLLAVAAVPLLRRWLPEAATGASAAAAASTLPAVAGGALAVVAAAGLAVPAWQLQPGTTLAASPAGGWSDPAGTLALWAATLLGIGCLAALLAVLPPVALRRYAPWPVPLLALVAALCPSLPVAAAAVLLLVLALAAAGIVARAVHGVRPVLRGPALALAGSAGTLGVVLGWAARPLSVPLTLVGVAGLLAARQLRPAAEVAAALAGAAATALIVAVGAVPAVLERPGTDAIVAAALTGAVLAALALCLPGFGLGHWSRPDRVAAAVPAVTAWSLGVATWPRLDDAQLRLVLAAGLLAAVATALAARPLVGALPPVLAAAAGPPLAGALATVLLPAASPAVVLAATVAAGGAVLAALVLAAGLVDPRRPALEAGLAATALVALLTTADQPRLWLVLLGLGTGAAAAAATPGRSRLGWLAGVLLTGSTWTRLELADVGVVEAYTLPPAAALLAVGLLRLRRDRATRPWRALLPAAGLGVLPSVLAAAEGSTLRPWLLLALAAAGVAAAWLRAGRVTAVLLAVAAVAAAGVGGLRPLHAVLDGADAVQDVELWSLPAAVVVLAAAVRALRLKRPAGRSGVARAIAAAPVLLAGLPTLLAAALAGPGSSWRAGVVLAAALAVALLLAVRLDEHWQAPLGVGAVATLVGLLLDEQPAELWTLPLGAALLALGALQLQRRPRGGSWPAMGPGLAVTLLPGLWLSTTGGPVRVVGFAVLAAGVLLGGAVLRWQAPLLAGAAALGVHALVQLAPWLSAAYQALPRWVVLAVLGGLLLGVGATYEQRLQQLRLARHRLVGLR